MDVTAKLAGFVTDLNYEDIPPKALQTAKIAVRDCLGVALAGSQEEDAKICAEIARQKTPKRRPPSSVRDSKLPRYRRRLPTARRRTRSTSTTVSL